MSRLGLVLVVAPPSLGMACKFSRKFHKTQTRILLESRKSANESIALILYSQKRARMQNLRFTTVTRRSRQCGCVRGYPRRVISVGNGDLERSRMQTRRGTPEEHPTAETGRGKQIRRVRLGCEPQRDRVSRSLCSFSVELRVRNRGSVAFWTDARRTAHLRVHVHWPDQLDRLARRRHLSAYHCLLRHSQMMWPIGPR